MNWRVMRSDVHEVEIQLYDGKLLPWDTNISVKVNVTLTLEEAVALAKEIKEQAERVPL